MKTPIFEHDLSDYGYSELFDMHKQCMDNAEEAYGDSNNELAALYIMGADNVMKEIKNHVLFSGL